MKLGEGTGAAGAMPGFLSHRPAREVELGPQTAWGLGSSIAEKRGEQSILGLVPGPAQLSQGVGRGQGQEGVRGGPGSGPRALGPLLTPPHKPARGRVAHVTWDTCGPRLSALLPGAGVMSEKAGVTGAVTVRGAREGPEGGTRIVGQPQGPPGSGGDARRGTRHPAVRPSPDLCVCSRTRRGGDDGGFARERSVWGNKAGSVAMGTGAGRGQGPRGVLPKAHHSLGPEESWSFSVSLTSFYYLSLGTTQCKFKFEDTGAGILGLFLSRTELTHFSPKPAPLGGPLPPHLQPSRRVLPTLLQFGGPLPTPVCNKNNNNLKRKKKKEQRPYVSNRTELRKYREKLLHRGLMKRRSRGSRTGEDPGERRWEDTAPLGASPSLGLSRASARV